MSYSITQLLTQLQGELANAGLWQDKPVAEHLLQSSQPFCVDTLRFEQWLQFVFIPKMRALIHAKHPLPSAIALTPMAEVYWSGQYAQLHTVLKCIDITLGGGE
ncbi:YqcC family protein [Pseudoalteromonas sp. MM17-2]|uniref:YqcC family protein n=1 Tax=Pseudoalteromonas sp. MM17-2 TaxID=2917753 RepID=UPI001EF45833|nr:YqcC family protein [Pseudoalteromonas sp. MM17-2]MCG7545161.1 YqcC family protein [Pseudoalteromonas sp. MM17-2]